MVKGERKERKEEGNGRGGGEVGTVEKRDERERGGKRERGGEREREVKECTEKLGKFKSFKFNFFKV